MSLKDTFTRGFVWKLAGLLAIMLVSYVMTGEAQAHTQGCMSTQATCSKGTAQALAQNPAAAIAKAHCTQFGYGEAGGYGEWTGKWVSTQDQVNPDQSGSFVTHYALVAPNGYQLGCGADVFYYKAQTCSANDPPLGSTWVTGDAEASSSSMCKDGCLYVGDTGDMLDSVKVDGINYTKFSKMTPWGQTCTEGPPSSGQGSEGAPPGDGDGDGTSDGSDGSPSNPGSQGGGGSEQEEGPKPCGGAGQPACGPEGKGEGSGNGNTSGGGGNCATPPNSSGDAIGAQIAYQTWATRCAIEKSQNGDGTLKTKEAGGTGTGTGTGGTGTGGLGTCSASEVGTAMCTMKEALASIKGFFDGIGSEAGGLDTSEGETEEPGSVWAEEGGEELDLDASGFGMAGGGCPPAPTYMGYSLDAAGNMCLFATIIGALVLAAGYVQAAYIIGRA